MLKTIKCSITTPVFDAILVHGVNCQGRYNAGVAKVIRETYPLAYEEYAKLTKACKPEHLLGSVLLVDVEPSQSLYVANLFTQLYYGRGARYASVDAIETSLTHLLSLVLESEVLPRNLYLTKLGCGLGGLSWEYDVRPLLTDLFSQYPTINCYVCDP